MKIAISVENPHKDICGQSIAELSTELGPLYGDDGGGAFAPDDVRIPRATFVVAWEEGKALGCGALRPMPDTRVGEIKRMFVRPSARGRGISRLILAKLESLAVEYAYQSLCLETGVRQPTAIALYKSAGFEPIPCYGEYAKNPYSVCYAKSLFS